VELSRNKSGVHVVVFEPATGGCGASRLLGGLGAEARVEVLSDVSAAVAAGRAPDVDLVVTDVAVEAGASRLLDELRRDGPPVVITGSELGTEAALDWFRRGAADCVSLAGRGSEVLAVVVLEQVRRWRAVRERGASERRIRDLERFNENVIRNMNSAVLVMDPEGSVTACNASAAQILGRSEADLTGRRVDDWFRDESGQGIVARSLATGARFRGAETLITRPDRTVVPIGISCAPITAADGSLRGAVATFQDLSEIRLLQRQVLQTEKLASIGQLSAGVAHEINNPTGFIHANLYQMSEYVGDLRRVWTLVEQLQKCVGQGEREELRRTSQELSSLAEEVDVDFLLGDLAKAIRESQEGAERIRHIVHDLRDFSHPDTGERVLADVNQCLDSTATIVWPMMKHLVRLEKEYRDLPAIPCFPTQIKQVFTNLMVNAYQSIEEKVGISGGEIGRIQLDTSRRGDCVVVSVSDTGVGIEPGLVDRIFDPFYTTKKVGEGTGLGLSTSFSIVQRHGGTIEVESTPGEGATFRVVLPLDECGDVES
jgi:PAS domain S-box-containing protein